MDSVDHYGPPLPPGFKQTWSDDSSNEAQEIPTCTEEEKKIIVGPQCPPDLARKQSSDDSTHSEPEKSDNDEDTRPVGPKLPRESTKGDSHEDDYEEDTYGPIPSMQNNATDDVDDVVASVEKRAKDMKRKLDGGDVPVKKIEREEWMTVPNTSSKNQLGAISRCLSNDPSKKQKSSDKARKHYKSSKTEEKVSKELEKYNKSKRSESLLEMHQKEKKKKKNKEKDDKPPERKPFDRDADMSLRLMDKSQVKSVIDKAKYLDSRFSRGQAKYL